MNKLPTEIEDEIWQLYWMGEFKDKVLHELISVSSFHEKLQEIDDVIRKNLRYIRFNQFTKRRKDQLLVQIYIRTFFRIV